MANHVSSLKRARQTETRTAVNRANRSRVRTSLRSLREALAKGDVKAAQEQFRTTVSALLHKENSNRSAEIRITYCPAAHFPVD